MAYVQQYPGQRQFGFDPTRADNWLSPGGFVLAALIAASAYVGYRLLK